MKKHITIIFLFIITLGFSQNPNRTFESTNYKSNSLEIKVNDGTYKIIPFSSKIIETTFIPSGEKENPNSHAVILKPLLTSLDFSEDDDKITLNTKGISVTIQKMPFQISYAYKGKPVISEKLGYVKNDSLETIQFNLTKDEILYGGGARALGMNRRGNRLQLYNRAHYGYETRSELMNYTMPIVLSSNQYLVHFDNAPIGFLDLDSKKENTLTYETISGRKTYQVVVGDSWMDVVDNYTDLTGKQPMPPRWALGNFSSRFGYHTQKEVEETVQKFRDEQIPLDAVIIDIFWFGKDIQGHMGNLEFLKDSFPNPTQMIKGLTDKNVNTILVTEPFILTSSKRWQEAVEKNILAKDSLGNPYIYDFYFGNTGLIDIYSEKGRNWFKDIYIGLVKKGVTGFWGDLGEPEVHPSDLLHATGTADEVHNIYGHDWAKLIYEACLEAVPDRRPFILMRAGYSGSQRYGLIPWSGDVNRTWGGLQSQPEIALQMGMQGLAYMHSDLGGFAGANLDDELYVRWLQYGVFQPIFRPHGQEEVPSEAIYRSDKAKALAKKAIELRYEFLPYNYNLAFFNSQTGAPLMRPLFFEEAENEKLYNYSKTYLWGNDILVSPILESGINSQEVYFPKGNKWYDFYSNAVFEGGQKQMVSVKEENIPTFVRAGSILPMAKSYESTNVNFGVRWDVHYYFDENIQKTENSFYSDGGTTINSYSKGFYSMLHLKAEIDKNKISIKFEREFGGEFIWNGDYSTFIIHNIPNSPISIKFNGKKVEVNWDATAKTLSIPIKWNTAKENEIKIKLTK